MSETAILKAHVSTSVIQVNGRAKLKRDSASDMITLWELLRGIARSCAYANALNKSSRARHNSIPRLASSFLEDVAFSNGRSRAPLASAQIKSNQIKSNRISKDESLKIRQPKCAQVAIKSTHRSGQSHFACAKLAAAKSTWSSMQSDHCCPHGDQPRLSGLGAPLGTSNSR